jgi:hypothetical protein
MKHIFTALALVLSGSAVAADRCTELAELATMIAESKAAGIPQASVASSLRAQYESDTEEQRNGNAMVEHMLPAIYRLNEKPQHVRHVIYLKCKAGEFAPKKTQ